MEWKYVKEELTTGDEVYQVWKLSSKNKMLKGGHESRGYFFYFFNVVALVMSFAINNSILWAIFHFFCGWIYVIYWLFSYTDILNWVKSYVVY